MRASEILSRRSPEERRKIAASLRTSSADADALLTAMRGSSLLATLTAQCDTPLLREDLALLAANPFDPVADDEIVDAALFTGFGLVEKTGATEFRVNHDMALTLLPKVALEFGFAATLLARLTPAELTLVARAVEVGPRATPIDYVLEVAAALVAPERVMRNIAHLRASERETIQAALKAGELPSKITGIAALTSVPQVQLDPGPAGQRGLVFQVEFPERGLARRPVVPLEIASKMGLWLEKVPPPPEVATRRTVPKRPRSPRAEKAKAAETETVSPPAPSAAPSSPYIVDSALFPGGPTPFAPPAPSAPFRSQRAPRQAAAVAASAIVDLQSARMAELVTQDDELSDAVLETGETLVVLRDGVDVADWLARCAARLRLTGPAVPFDAGS